MNLRARPERVPGCDHCRWKKLPGLEGGRCARHVIDVNDKKKKKKKTVTVPPTEDGLTSRAAGMAAGAVALASNPTKSFVKLCDNPTRYVIDGSRDLFWNLTLLGSHPWSMALWSSSMKPTGNFLSSKMALLTSRSAILLHSSLLL